MKYSLLTVILLAFGCGSGNVELSGDGGNNNGDGGNNAGDAGNNGDGGIGGCTAGDVQCNNCIDDDGDGLIDGDDPHCVSAEDDDEASFATGIPGDNMDAVNQDCFFDGNSGGGDDGCNIHVCCLLAGECPPDLKPGQFDPNDCGVSQECIDNCGAAAPPGCDCFGCCTVCNGTDCADVLIHPEVSPDCDIDVLDDPALCPPCNKVQECGTDCQPGGCILCPGQTQDDLPPECNGMNECPGDLTPCDTTDDCAELQFCSNGCCINSIG